MGQLIRSVSFFPLVLLTLFLLNSCCTTFPWLPWCPEIVEFTPGSFTLLCPNHIGGDREFDGHGPAVKASATLKLKNLNKELWVELYLHAKETRSDWTEAEGKWEYKIWDAPSGKKIKRIISDSSSGAQYVDTDHTLDIPTVTGGSLVYKFEIMGDTRGNDVGNCTADDVYMNVYFNSVTLELASL